MRAGLPVLACPMAGLVLALSACSAEPDFDQRYAQQQQELERTAKAIDQELDQRMTEKPGLEESTKPVR
mgnify:CR=1 FL=1